MLDILIVFDNVQGAVHDSQVKTVSGVTTDCDMSEEGCGCGQDFIMSGSSNGTNQRRFSNCSVARMVGNVTQLREDYTNCLVEVDQLETEVVQVDLCGNNVVEGGEECDCGDDQETCDDPCCYPAHIGAAERGANDSALPCSRTERRRCVTPASLMFGVYMPLAFILVMLVLTGVLLRNDWVRDKKFFVHITEGNVRIVNKRHRDGTRQTQALYS